LIKTFDKVKYFIGTGYFARNDRLSEIVEMARSAFYVPPRSGLAVGKVLFPREIAEFQGTQFLKIG
jgi:hypothetical protein